MLKTPFPLICQKTSSISSNNHDNQNKEQCNLDNSASPLNGILKEYDACFTNSIPHELPPSLGVDDHRIELI